MDIIDFFAFTIKPAKENDLSDVKTDDLTSILTTKLSPRVKSTQYAVFDYDLPERPEQLEELSRILRTNASYYSQIAPLGTNNAISRIATARDAGAATITFHPYLQQINADRHREAVQLAHAASEMGLPICICTAYGSSEIHNVTPLEVASSIAEAVSTPVVLVHGGGAKVIEAMLIADAFPNVYLDTSFSLSYWLGSSVEKDMAFAMKKLGPEKWMFGSDAPFVELDKALDDHFYFLDRHGFSTEFVASVMGQNALNLLEKKQ
jgi:uncharacterized protein